MLGTTSYVKWQIRQQKPVTVQKGSDRQKRKIYSIYMMNHRSKL